MARALLSQRNTPVRLWPFAVKAAAYIYNRTPKTSKNGAVPLNILTQQKPKPNSLNHLRVFGCLCYTHQRKQDRPHGKLDKNALPGIFIGYPPNMKGYLIYQPANDSVHHSRDVTFIEEEDGSSLLSHEEREEEDRQRIFGEASLDNDEDYQPDSDDSESDEEYEAPNNSNDAHDSTTITPAPSPNTSPSSSSSTERQQTPSLPNSPATVESRYPRRDRRPPGEFWKINQEANSATDIDPSTLKQALKSPQANEWKTAMASEMKSLEENKTWEEISAVPSGRNIITTKWVFKTKRDESGQVERYKARLVARGYTQTHGIDYKETFAPVTRMSTIRIICAIAALKQYSLKQMDAKTAYLNAPLPEELYIQIPQGYTAQNHSTTALRLKKALYGLKQAGREWNDTLTKYLLTSQKWIQSPNDPCLFKANNGTTHAPFYMAVFVDDFIAAVGDERDWDNFITDFQTHFKISNNGALSWMLGMKIQQTNNNKQVAISQHKYITEMLDEFGMNDCNEVTTPITTSPPGKPEQRTPEEQEWASKTPYQGLTGSLLYATRCTRPDTTFAIHHASRFNNNYNKQNWKSAKRMLAYLKRTSNHKLQFNHLGNQDLIGYVDADWASDKEDRRSVHGYVFLLAGAAITWRTGKQNSVALSTCEAEYVGMAEAAQEATYLRQILTFLDLPQNNATTVYADNRSAIFLSQNPSQHNRAKHIDIKYHYTREAQTKHIVRFIPIATNENVADCFTKPMSREKLERYTRAMGIV